MDKFGQIFEEQEDGCCFLTLSELRVLLILVPVILGTATITMYVSGSTDSKGLLVMLGVTCSFITVLMGSFFIWQCCSRVRREAQIEADIKLADNNNNSSSSRPTRSFL